MANKSGNNAAGAASSDVPALHSFEFDKTAIGNIKSSVNKFRGCVSLPLDFLTLPGLEGLDVKLSVLYSSNIRKDLNTWNLEAPTGILGLGWQMPIEMIVADKAGSASPASDSYYLVSAGSANPLVKTGETGDGKWIYQLRNFQFWSIQYDPLKKTWTVIKENGFVYTYGAGTDAASNATQWGVSCGNWIGAGNVGATQVQYPLAWNLACVVTPMGNKVQYQYLNVNQPLISSALKYTQASYLGKVIDSYGRTITFNYGNKYGVLNPGSAPDGKPIVEYQPKHTQPAPPFPNAYQDRYETCFLDSVDVADPDGNPLSGLRFTYTFLNNGFTSDSNYPLMYKRCLQSVFQYANDGSTLPAMNFEYFPANPTSTNPCALSAVTYPEGGRALFEYKEQIISSPVSAKKSQIKNPVPGSTPRVWFGTDYVVFTYAGNNSLQVKIQSWNGQWINQDVIIGKTAAPASLTVSTAENFFALSFRNGSTGHDELYLFRNDDKGQELQFGKWVMYNNQPFILTLPPQAKGASVFVAGDSFVMAYNKDYTAAKVQGFSYTWQDNRWNASVPPPVPPSPECQFAALAAFQNFYAVACYLQSSRQLKNYIFYRTADGTWKQGSNWTLNNVDVVIDPKSNVPYLSVSLMPTSLAFTFATKATDTSISYGLRLYNWDENFFVLNTAAPAAADLSSPVVSGKSLYEVFQTLVVGSTVNNNLALLRNGGGDQHYGSVWKQATFQAPGATTALNVAAGDDVAILSPSSGSAANQLATFNPNAGSWLFSAGQVGNNPSLSGNYMTVGKTIGYRDTNGTWKVLPTQLNNFNYPQSLQNRGPRFITYQDAGDATASTFVVPLKNGNAQLTQKLNAVKTYVPDNLPGTLLVAGRFLVTYPSSSASFDAAPSVDLWNVDDVNFDQFVKDTPVAYVVIEDKYNPDNGFTQSFYYANSPESQIVFNAQAGVAQYPLVTVVPGVKEKTVAPTSTPEGSSQFFYSNGLAQQSTLYPLGGIQNYQNILNGILLGQKDFGKDGLVVSSHLDYWTVYTKVADSSGFLKTLYGGYARCEKTASMKDGIVQWSRAGYDRVTGVMLWQEKSYYDAEGVQKNNRTETLYAFQVPEYAAAFNKLHNFTSVAMTTQSVSPADNSSRNYIGGQATTYRNWANNNAVTVDCPDTVSCRLAAYQTFDWATPGNTAPQFPSSDAALAAWQPKTRITARTDRQYLITEQVEGNSLFSSFIYDKEQRFLVAKFPNASLSGDEASYYGFETYETDQGWKIGPAASVIPNSQNPVVDAHTGTRSLSIAPATTGSNGIQRVFRPARQNQQYVFSAWVKKPSEFKNESGTAAWKIAVAGGPSYNLNFPDTVGQWVYVFQLITFPGPSGSAQIEIVCENLNAASNVLVDNLRFTPLASLAEAYSYGRKLQPPDAVLGPNGETSRSLFDRFNQQILSTNAADRTSKIQSGYFSRSGNQGLFSERDPNHSLTITGANGGQLTGFTRGSEWTSVWQPQADTWKVNGTQLMQKAGNLPGWLACNDNKLSTNYALDVEFNVLETLTAPLGVQLGSALVIQQNPQAAAWQLLAAVGGSVLSKVDARAFTLPVDPYAAQLDAGTVSEALSRAFAAAGYLLPVKSKISAGAATGKGWTLTSPDNAYRYALKADGSQIAVYTTNTRWTLLVCDKTVVFWADGKMIFSYSAAAPFSAPPKLFFGNQVAVSQIAFASGPLANIAFDDSRGMNIQSQQYAGSQMIVMQAIADNMGRTAVRTKPAYITPDQNPMFGYCSKFATMDWKGGTVSGLVSNAYPADKGYPFTRQTFEPSPLARITQESIPGEPFRVNGGKCTTYAYGAVAGQSQELVFSKKTTTNPNGGVFYEIGTLLDQVIQNVSATGTEIRNETYYDDAGNATIIRSPNYFAPPVNSQPGDWLTLQSFDSSNRLLTFQQGTKAPTRFIYDKGGNLRFTQDAQGASAGTFNYTKYDALSRPVETGYVTGAWNQQQLQQYANADPSWPQNTPTWRTKNWYDEDNAAANAIGRVTRMQANNGNGGTADVSEKLAYDVFGNVLSDNLTVNAFDAGKERNVSYAYNDLGTITAIAYPLDVYGYSVFYQLNSLNQITKITDKTPSGESTIGNFGYDAAGNPLENRLVLENNATVKQTYAFNSPNWLTNINNQNPGGENLMREDMTYTEGGYAGAGYFDGAIASAAVQVSGPDPSDKFQYAYDPIGQVANASNTGSSLPDGGAQTQFTYDQNGNFLNRTGGGTPYAYAYNRGTQEVAAITETASAKPVAQFGYDGNGNVTQLNTSGSNLTRPGNLAITYDPATMLSTAIVNAMPGGATVNLTYGCRNERVMKEVSGGSATGSKKLYIRGTSTMPLQELVSSADGQTKTSVNYIYGPNGLIAMRRWNGAGADLFHLLKDHIGSVRGVMNLKGEVVASYRYTTFGVLVTMNEPAPGFMPYLYTGQEYDAEIGLYNYRARFYCADIGRFIAIDPGRQYFSPYLYASNNPVLFIDPTGMFSIKNFFSAIGGILIGAVEILIGVVIDVIAGVVAFFTGGLGTPASIAIGALSGTFYGAGVSAITYSVFHFDDFSWKDYGIQMGIGAASGLISGGFGAAVSIAAKSAQVALSEFAVGARAAGGFLDVMGQGGAATVAKAGAWVAEKGSALAGLATSGPVMAGWQGLVKGIGIGVIKSEAIGISMNTAKNLALGNDWDKNLGQVIFSSALSGSIAGLQVRNRVEFSGK